MATRKLKRKKTNSKFYNRIDHLEEELNQPIVGLRVLIVIFIIAIVLVGSVWQKVNVTELAQDIEQLEKEKKAIEEQIAELESIALKLSDRKRLISIAENRLNMIFPDSELIQVNEKYDQIDQKR